MLAFEYLIICFFAFILGYCLLIFASYLDRHMKYGGRFNFIRHRMFLKYASKEIIDELKFFQDINEFGNMEYPEGFKFKKQVDFMDVLYLKALGTDTKFKLWMCRECMSTNLALFVNLVFIIFYITENGFSIYNIFLYIFINLFSITGISLSEKNA